MRLQVFAVRSGGATGVVVKGPDDKSSVAFRYRVPAGKSVRDTTSERKHRLFDCRLIIRVQVTDGMMMMMMMMISSQNGR